MKQKYSSANTSINSVHLPAIYGRINWGKLHQTLLTTESTVSQAPMVIDIGAGRFTEHIRKYVLQHGFDYFPYDPYWFPKSHNQVVLNLLRLKNTVAICSNVLNVIPEDENVAATHRLCKSVGSGLYFISVYEGNRSCIGATTRKDCYQRNQPLSAYLEGGEEIKCSTITCKDGLPYLTVAGK